MIVQDSTGILAVHVTLWQVRRRWKASKISAHQRQRELFRVHGILDWGSPRHQTLGSRIGRAGAQAATRQRQHDLLRVHVVGW